jgi:SAM-dependent methyltransferase
MLPLPNVWDDIFRDRGHVFAEPHEDMPAFARALRARGGRTLLDLGSGTGRHVVYFARQGFATFGLDIAPEGLRLTRQWLATDGLTAGLCRQNLMAGLPYRDASFDALISVQVIHHAPIAVIRQLIGEMARVLAPGGLVFASVPKLQNQGHTYRQLEPGTFVPLDGQEAGLPHHYFTPDELREEFAQFDVTDIHLDSVDHYCLLGTRR